MKKIFSAVLFSAFATNSFAAEPVKLTCKISEVCFEKELESASTDFALDGGGFFKIEVTAKNGASVGFKTEGAESYASAMQMGPETVEKTITLQGVVGKGGKFSINVEPAQIVIDGKPLGGSKSYKLKITRQGTITPLPIDSEDMPDAPEASPAADEGVSI